MSDSKSPAEGTEQSAEPPIQSLRDRAQKAKAGERRARALLESVTALMGLSDPTAVMRGVAENAVEHVGVSAVRVYRVDHDAGVLVEAARAEMAAPDGFSPPGSRRVRLREVECDPIPMRPGNQLAEFALGNRAELLGDLGPGDGDESGRAHLMQMRTVRSSEEGGRGVLVGVLVTSWSERPTAHETGLLRSLASMGAAAAEAARIEEFRGQLVSAVSHELRTPLAAIRAYNELLLDEDAGEINDEQRLFLQRIETTCLHLDRMVEDLLDLSRLRAGEVVVNRHPVDVVGVIEHIVDTLSPEAAKRNVSLSDEIVGRLPLVVSNPDRLAQVLFNLVGNAVKYVQESGSVLVRVSLCDGPTCADRTSAGADAEATVVGEDGECLLIEVIDDGPGIAPEEIDRVFDEFYRGRLTEGTTRGAGLGLAIASRITRLLGGVLEVDSTPGEGSTFWLMFPVETVDETEIS